MWWLYGRAIGHLSPVFTDLQNVVALYFKTQLMPFHYISHTESTTLIYSMHFGNTILRCLRYTWKLQQNSVGSGVNASLCLFAKPLHSLMFLLKKQIPIILYAISTLSSVEAHSWWRTLPQWQKLALCPASA